MNRSTACVLSSLPLAVSLTLGMALPRSSGAAEADDATDARAGTLWIASGFLSHHTSHRREPRRGWNETNTGLGLEYDVDERWRLAAGLYENSVYRTSRYMQAVWTPEASHWQHGSTRITLGAAVGLVDGYPRMNHGGWVPTLLPVASVEAGRIGLNLSYIPSLVGQASGAVAIQAKLLLY